MEKKFLNIDGLTEYDALIKAFVKSKVFIGTYAEYEIANNNGKIPVDALVIITDDEAASGGGSWVKVTEPFAASNTTKFYIKIDSLEEGENNVVQIASGGLPVYVGKSDGYILLLAPDPVFDFMFTRGELVEDNIYSFSFVPVIEGETITPITTNSVYFVEQRTIDVESMLDDHEERITSLENRVTSLESSLESDWSKVTDTITVNSTTPLYVKIDTIQEGVNNAIQITTGDLPLYVFKLDGAIGVAAAEPQNGFDEAYLVEGETNVYKFNTISVMDGATTTPITTNSAYLVTQGSNGETSSGGSWRQVGSTTCWGISGNTLTTTESLSNKMICFIFENSSKGCQIGSQTFYGWRFITTLFDDMLGNFINIVVDVHESGNNNYEITFYNSSDIQGLDELTADMGLGIQVYVMDVA